MGKLLNLSEKRKQMNIDWVCQKCKTKDMEYMYSKSTFNGNKDDSWYCEVCYGKKHEKWKDINISETKPEEDSTSST